MYKPARDHEVDLCRSSASRSIEPRMLGKRSSRGTSREGFQARVVVWRQPTVPPVHAYLALTSPTEAFLPKHS